MTAGLVARLRAPLERSADFADALADGWQTADAADVARRTVPVEGSGSVPLGDLFEITGTGDGTIRFLGDLDRADRIGAGLRGGEVIVEGKAGREVGARMRRGLITVVGNAGARAGRGAIAGSVIIVGDAGAEPGLWSKRGTVVVLGAATPPPTYRYACTYQPPHLRLTLTRLRHRFGLPITPRHVDGLYDRYSGDFAELGKGEILRWHAT